MIYIAFAGLVVSFLILFKCADYFVDGACGIAEVLHMPKIVIGIVLMAFATTAPEFAVSVQAAIAGLPEIALGNAIGSVICDDGIALGLAALLAPAVIYINCRMLKIVGLFLLSIDFIAYFLARNGRLGRLEGLILILLLGGYFFLVFRNRGLQFEKGKSASSESCSSGAASSEPKFPLLKKPILLFLIGVGGVIISGHIIVKAAVFIAKYFAISETIIGLTVVAIGTSLPEISTCITAARKGEGEIAVGNIIGADVLNILWIIGASALVRPIQVDLNVINFSFPFMILIVTVMLAGMRIGCRLGKIKGLILLLLYAVYLGLTLKLFI